MASFCAEAFADNVAAPSPADFTFADADAVDTTETARFPAAPVPPMCTSPRNDTDVLDLVIAIRVVTLSDNLNMFYDNFTAFIEL